MSRESKNPVTGRRSAGSYIAAGLVFLLFLSVAVMLSLWAYYSAAETAPGIWKYVSWIYLVWTKGLCSPTEAWRHFIAGGWAVLLVSDLIGLALFVLVARRRGSFAQIEHGSAHWATSAERGKFRDTGFDLPLADGIYLSPLSNPANRNVLVAAAPGGGKTFRVIIPGIEAVTRPGRPRPCSFFATDTKGAIYRDTVSMVSERGLKTYLLNLADPWSSDRYNPLELVYSENKEKEIAALALAFAKNARDDEAGVGDSIWEDTFKALLIALWSYQYDFSLNPLTGRAETKALWRTADLIRSIRLDKGQVDISCEAASIIEAVRAINPFHPACSNFDFVCKGAAETVSSVVFTAGSKMQIFTYPEIQDLTSANEIPLDEICRSPAAVYLNFDIGSPYKAIAALFIEQLFSTAYRIAEQTRDGRLPVDLQLFLDELPNLCSVYSLPQRLSTSRSYGIDVLLSVQSMQQVEKMFKNAEETLKNNCVTHVYLGTGEPKALKEISEALGKTTTGEVNRTENVGGRQGGGSRSDRSLGRELALPSEIYSMPDAFAIVKQQHHQPIFAKKFPTEKQKWYSQLGGRGNLARSRVIADDYSEKRTIRKAEYAQSINQRRKELTHNE